MANSSGILRLFGVNIIVAYDRTALSNFVVYNPTPLRCFMPRSDGENSRKRRKKRADGDYDSTTPVVPLEEIPELMKQIEDLNGTNPVFLYGKELVKSDVCKRQNRLLVNKMEKFEELFRDEDLERGKVVEGVDGGNKYELGLRIWNNLVVKKEWRKVVANNGAKEGDLVQVWGFWVEEERKTCLAVRFVESSALTGVSSSNAGNS